MKKEYLIFPVVVICIIAGFLSYNGNEEEVKRQCVRVPEEHVYVGAVVFSDGEAELLGAEYENGEQVKRVAGTYVVRVDNQFLTIEIYSWGTRTLLKKETYELSGLQKEYPVGVSIWVEQDATSAVVVLVPWQ